MARRPYRQRRRADAAAATRRRIVEATLALHDEQGISGTSVRDIAGRASVAPSTVLHHFPVMDELIRACGELSDQLAPIPTDGVLAGASTRRERVARVAAAIFGWWEALGPGFDHLRMDRHRIPGVDAWMGDVAARIRHLARLAVGEGDDLDLLVALLTADAWGVLRDRGLDPERAAARVAQRIGDENPKRKAVH